MYDITIWDEASHSLKAPRANGSFVLIPMLRINTLMSRCQDVATVNTHKAPELLATLNTAWLEIKTAIATLELLMVEAQRVANQRMSVVILDEAPKILLAKGLVTSRTPSGSADQREAILAADTEYDVATNRVALLKAMIQIMKDKQENVENAYNSTKKVLGANNEWSGYSQQRGLSAAAELPAHLTPGMTYDPLYIPTTPTPTPVPVSNSLRSRFGGAK